MTLHNFFGAKLRACEDEQGMCKGGCRVLDGGVELRVWLRAAGAPRMTLGGTGALETATAVDNDD